MDEILYSFRLNKFGSLEVAKWDGHERPLDVYRITSAGKGKCDCMGSMRNPYCKHRAMVDKVLEIASREGVTLVGAFYDADKGVLYTPSDGEGIPLEGPATIRPVVGIGYG